MHGMRVVGLIVEDETVGMITTKNMRAIFVFETLSVDSPKIEVALAAVDFAEH